MIVEMYFNSSVSILDKEFGEGFAKANPQVVAALIAAHGKDLETTVLLAGVFELTETLEKFTHLSSVAEEYINEKILKLRGAL